MTLARQRPDAYLVVAFSRPAQTLEIINFLINENLDVYLFVDKARTNHTLNNQVMDLTVLFSSFPNFKFKISKSHCGAEHGVEAALDWIFESEEVVVILEDDSVVTKNSISYFEQASHFLNNRVAIISSRAISDFRQGAFCMSKSHLSQFALTNGWMTTRDFWTSHYGSRKSSYRIMVSKIKSLGLVRAWSAKCFFLSGTKRFEAAISKVGWDQKVVFTLLRDNLYSLVPNRTVVGNRGVDGVASNTTGISQNSHFLYEADIEYPSLEICSDKFCKRELENDFVALYGIQYRHILSPIKTFFEIALSSIMLPPSSNK